MLQGTSPWCVEFRCGAHDGTARQVCCKRCRAALRRAVPRRAVPCCAMPRRAAPWCGVPRRAMLCRAAPRLHPCVHAFMPCAFMAAGVHAFYAFMQSCIDSCMGPCMDACTPDMFTQSRDNCARRGGSELDGPIQPRRRRPRILQVCV